MGNKERYIIFGIGVFIGSLILTISYLGKYHASKKQKEEDGLKGYKASIRITPGQDLKAKKPYDISPALFSKDLEEDVDGRFTRIIIAEGSGKESSIFRIVETLWKDPQNLSREKLISRQIMAADRVVVRLKENKETNNDIEVLKKELQDLNMEFIGTGRGPRLYMVKLASYDVDTIPKAIESLQLKSQLIEAVFPDYVTNF